MLFKSDDFGLVAYLNCMKAGVFLDLQIDYHGPNQLCKLQPHFLDMGISRKTPEGVP